MQSNTLSLAHNTPWPARIPERPVRAGIIGCGAFGSGILAQAASVPLLEVPAARAEA